jgi:hypothetical protein
MIANENEKAGLFGTSVMISRARDTVQRVSGRRNDGGDKTSTPPFTRNARLVFESARTVLPCFRKLTHTASCKRSVPYRIAFSFQISSVPFATRSGGPSRLVAELAVLGRLCLTCPS